MNQFALITGASQGIGKYMAIELAKKGISLVLVALPTAVLEETAQVIQTQYPAIKVYTIGVDLTDDYAAQKVYDRCQEKKIAIQYLINNAGMGYTGAFDSFPIDFLDNLMKLNMLATTRLIRLFIDDLKQQPKAYILNVASIAGLYDIPYKVVYSASKSFVYTFSRALREELKGTSVSVTVLCPGGVATNPDALAAVARMGRAARMLTTMPGEVAKVGIKAMFKGKAVVIPKFTIRLYASMRHVIPYPLQLKILGYFLRRKYKNV